MAHYVLVTGGRDVDPSVAQDVIGALTLLRGLYGPDLRVMHGACPAGVDAMADAASEHLGIRCRGVPADWEGRGRAAGPLRNQVMVERLTSWLAAGHTAQVLVFPGGRGTANCATLAENAGLNVSYLTATEPGAPTG